MVDSHIAQPSCPRIKFNENQISQTILDYILLFLVFFLCRIFELLEMEMEKKEILNCFPLPKLVISRVATITIELIFIHLSVFYTISNCAIFALCRYILPIVRYRKACTRCEI